VLISAALPLEAACPTSCFQLWSQGWLCGPM